jgi:hypothetical protein
MPMTFPMWVVSVLVEGFGMNIGEYFSAVKDIQ